MESGEQQPTPEARAFSNGLQAIQLELRSQLQPDRPVSPELTELAVERFRVYLEEQRKLARCR